LLKIDALSLQRGNKLCVSDVHADILPGQLTAIVGPNGAGKSSLLKGLSGEWPLAAGCVSLYHEYVENLSPLARATSIAVMPQQQKINFDFTVEEFVAIGRAPYRKYKDNNDLEIVAFCLAQVGLLTYARRSVLSLSGGELQRAYLAKAVAQICGNKPEYPGKGKLLLLDEPTSALDMAQQIITMDLLTTIAKKGGIVLTVMHDLNLVSSFADQVLLMKEGRVMSKGSPENVLVPSLLHHCFGCHVQIDKRACDKKSIVSVVSRATA